MVPVVSLLIGVLLCLQRVQGELICEIHSQELIIVAVVRARVRIQCEVWCHQTNPDNVTVPTPKPADLAVNLYKNYSYFITTCFRPRDTLVFTAVCELTVTDTRDSGMYSCLRNMDPKDRRAEAILLRVQDPDTVNVKSSSSLQYALVALCLILALYSGSATTVILIKRQVCNSCMIWQKKSAPADTPQLSPTQEVPPRSEPQREDKPHSAEPANSDNTYMPLQTHQQSIYNTLDNDKNSNQDCSGTNKPPKGLGAEGYDNVYESF